MERINRQAVHEGARGGEGGGAGLKISSGSCRSGLHADFRWQLYMLTTTSGDADTNPD